MTAQADLHCEAYRDVACLPAAVCAALAQAEHADVEQGEAWLKNLTAQVFPNDPGVAFHVLYRGERVLAVLPLRRDAQGTVWALGNFYTSLFQPFFDNALQAGDLAVLLKAVLAVHRPVVALRIAPMDVQGRHYQTLTAAMQAAGLWIFPYFCFGNWYLPVETDWAGYFGGRSSQLRNSVRRKGKDFEKAGGMLTVITGSDEVNDAIAAYEAVYSSSWKVPEPFPGFVPGLVRFLAEKKWLRLGIAYLDGQPIAAQIWIVAHGKASIFKLAYHETFKRYSAGTLLTARLMAQAIDEDRVRKIDYLIGDDPYKSTWMTKRRERWGVLAFNPGHPQGVIGAAREFLAKKAKRLLASIRQRGAS